MPGPGFNWVFGGSAVQPAQASYIAIALSANTTLVWPPQAPTGSVVAAHIMDVTPSGAGLTLSMPPANQTSAGWDALVTNKGASTFTLATNTGIVIASIAPGQQYYIYLTDPTTVSGVWNVTLFGSGSSALTASAVAGVGLLAIGATLSPNFVTSVASASPVNLSATLDRSAQYVWTGGAGVVNLPALASIPAPDGYFVTINNKGTGTLTITPNGGDNLDGANAVELMNPGYAATFYASSGSWYSFGPLATTKFAFTELVVTAANGNLSGVAGGGGVTFTLTNTQAANVVQLYKGVITANQTVVFPPAVQVYYVQNATSGAFTVSFKSGAGTQVTVPQNQNAILFSDGTNVVNASNITGSFTAVGLAAGSAASPSLYFNADTGTGIYQPASGQIGFAVSGVQRALLLPASFTAPAFVPTTSTVPSNGLYLSAANTLSWAINSAQQMYLNSSGLTLPTGSLTLTAGTFTGVGSGLTGVNATNVGTAVDNATNAAMYPTWVTSNAGGNLPEKVSTALSWNPSTGTLSATAFSGAGTGLTGTAAALNIGGSSNTATTAGTANALNTGNSYTINGLTNNGTTTLAGVFTNSAQSNFYATLSGPQTLGTTVIFNSAPVNVGGNYNTGNGVYMVPRNGVYSFTAAIEVRNSSGTVFPIIYLLVGSQRIAGRFDGSLSLVATATARDNMSFVGYLTTGTTVSLVAGTFTATYIANATVYSSFTGAQLF